MCPVPHRHGEAICHNRPALLSLLSGRRKFVCCATESSEPVDQLSFGTWPVAQGPEAEWSARLRHTHCMRIAGNVMPRVVAVDILVESRNL